MTTDELNSAISIYIGYQSAPFPQWDQSPVLEAFGASLGGRLCDHIRALMVELRLIADDISTTSTASISDSAVDVLGDVHPALNAGSLRALAWALSYEMR